MLSKVLKSFFEPFELVLPLLIQVGNPLIDLLGQVISDFFPLYVEHGFGLIALLKHQLAHIGESQRHGSAASLVRKKQWKRW